MVADLLRAQGFDVFLTSRTGDGGKDIWVSTFYGGSHFIALVECKVRDSKKAIDPSLARAVVGTYFIEKKRGISVNGAMMVTSSNNIGPETIKIEQDLREFSVIDCNALERWISKYGDIKNGLWVPGALAT